MDEKQPSSQTIAQWHEEWRQLHSPASPLTDEQFQQSLPDWFPTEPMHKFHSSVSRVRREVQRWKWIWRVVPAFVLLVACIVLQQEWQAYQAASTKAEADAVQTAGQGSVPKAGTDDVCKADDVAQSANAGASANVETKPENSTTHSADPGRVPTSAAKDIHKVDGHEPKAKADASTATQAAARSRAKLDCLKAKDDLEKRLENDGLADGLRQSLNGWLAWLIGLAGIALVACVATYFWLPRERTYLAFASEVVEADLLRGTPVESDAAVKKEESGNTSKAEEENQIKKASTSITSAMSAGLLEAVIAGDRFDELLKDIEHRCLPKRALNVKFLDQVAACYQEMFGVELQVPTLTKTRNEELTARVRDAARRVVFRTLARDPDFHYLLEEKAQSRRMWSRLIPAVLNRFKKPEEPQKRKGLGDAANNTTLIWLLAGVVPLGSYAAAKSVERSVEDHISSIHDEIKSTRQDTDSTQISAVDKEVEHDFYYMESQKQPDSGTPTSGQPTPFVPVRVECSPTNTVELTRDGVTQVFHNEDKAKTLEANAAGKAGTDAANGITLVCTPQQTVKIADGKQPIKDGQPDPPKGPTAETISVTGGDVLAPYWLGGAPISIDGVKHDGPYQKVTLDYGPESDGKRVPSRTFCLTLNGGIKSRRVPDPISLIIEKTDCKSNAEMQSAYIYKDKSSYSPILNADLSVVESKNPVLGIFGKGPRLGIWGKGWLVIRITPRTEKVKL